jgi:hypothetical protein
MADPSKPPIPTMDEKIVIEDSDDLSSGEAGIIPSTPHEDRLLTTKIDFKAIPILGVLYLICFLDRTNIANANIAGLEKGLKMPLNGYNTAL